MSDRRKNCSEDKKSLYLDINSNTDCGQKMISTMKDFQNILNFNPNHSFGPHKRPVLDFNPFRIYSGRPVPEQVWSNGKHNEVESDSKTTQPKRPILKKQFHAHLEATGAPDGPGWFDTYATDCNRFGNGLRNKDKDRHVQWGPPDPQTDSKDSYSEDSGVRWDKTNGQTFDSEQTNGEETDSKVRLSTNFWRFDDSEPNTCNSIVDSLRSGIETNTEFQFDYSCNKSNDTKGLEAISKLKATFMFTDSNPSIWANDCKTFGSNGLGSEDKSENAKKLIEQFRETIPKTDASYTWSGQLPRRMRSKHPIYSCKVFLGGIPYDLTDSDLHCTFRQFGPIQIQWPGKEIRSAIDGAAANKAGYVYIIFEAYDNVAELLNACTISYREVDTGCRWYYEVSSRRQKVKEVQVIPFDIGDRFHMKNSFTGQMEHSRTVFVGALHGMLSADGLAKVMDDLFGGVIFAGLDTDKHKYPLGSGRVSFDNQESYLKAISAAFVEIKSNRFKKKIQIDPYIENESMCSICRTQQQSPVFCRDDFAYFCNKCWDSHHLEPESAQHRPLIKNKPSTA